MARARALDGLRIAELREKASAAGVSGTDHMRKCELIEALRRGESLSTSGRFRRSTTDVLALLKADHAKIKGLLDETLAAADADAALEPIAKQIVAELARHAAAEKALVYPAVRPAAAEPHREAGRGDALGGCADGRSVKELMSKLGELEPTGESFEAVLQLMTEHVERHAALEERVVVDRARKLLDRDELDALGQLLAAREAPAKTDGACGPAA